MIDPKTARKTPRQGDSDLYDELVVSVATSCFLVNGSTITMQTSPFRRQFSGYAIAHLVAKEKGVINKETGFLDEV